GDRSMTNSGAVQAILFDARDTLGEVDRPGHLVPYRPSTEKLLAAVKNVLKLKIGIITNLPADVSDEQGRRMVVEAVLSEDPKAGKPVTIGDYIDAAASPPTTRRRRTSRTRRSTCSRPGNSGSSRVPACSWVRT